MKDESTKLLDKASRAVDAAEVLLAAGQADFAASRAYYAMFYAAEALLVERGLRFRKHGGVHSAFGRELVKTGLVDAKFHRWLLDAFDKRLLSDYGVEALVTARDAREVIDQASDFVDEARRQVRP